MFFSQKKLESSTRGNSTPTRHSSFNNERKDKSTYDLSREHDEPEVDYDQGATDLYQQIEEKNWDRAINRIDAAPFEAKTWVFRREATNPDKMRWRLLPIHATCVFRSPLSVIEALIAAYPDGPQMKDDQGMLPVHLACRNGASKGVVITLLNAFPESIRVKDRKGRTPLNFVEASQSQNREAVIVALRKFRNDLENKSSNFSRSAGTSSVAPSTRHSSQETEVDYEHRTILFRLVLKKEWTGAAQRSNSFPDEAGTWIVTKGFNGNLRFLPLHKACVLNPPENLIEALIAAFPDGPKSKDQDGWLPIHCACFYGANEGTVNTLLVAHPKGAAVKDDEGRMPLHYACLKNASEGVVSALVGSNPKSCMCKDDEGRLPIHHACSKGAAEGTIEVLLKASPKGAQSKDDQGRLPLHHACRKNASERVIKSLLRVYPRGAQVKDDQDKLPIHYASQNGAREGVINVLLATYPESINVKNGFGYTPLGEAKAMDNPNMAGVIEILEKFKTEQDQLEGKSAQNNAASNSEVEKKVVALTKRVETLEALLFEITKVGEEMKKENAKNGKEAGKAVNKLAEKLSSIGSFHSNTASDNSGEENSPEIANKQG